MESWPVNDGNADCGAPRPSNPTVGAAMPHIEACGARPLHCRKRPKGAACLRLRRPSRRSLMSEGKLTECSISLVAVRTTEHRPNIPSSPSAARCAFHCAGPPNMQMERNEPPPGWCHGACWQSLRGGHAASWAAIWDPASTSMFKVRLGSGEGEPRARRSVSASNRRATSPPVARPLICGVRRPFHE